MARFSQVETGRTVALAALVFALSLIATRPATAATTELLVGMQVGAQPDALAQTLAASGATLTHRLEALSIASALVPADQAASLRSALARRADVAFVETAPLLTTAAGPRDPYFERGDQWNIDAVQAAAAWELLPEGATTIVGIVDTGIDARHPDLAGQILAGGCDLVYGVCAGEGRRLPPDDLDGHGTHVAGIIGAATNNGVGIASVSGGRVRILPIRVEIGRTGALVNTFAGVVYAADQGAKVINGSFGGECTNLPSQAVDRLVNYLDSKGALLVMAAGNDGGCVNGRFPAAHPSVLAVAATDREGKLAESSSRGAWVSVAAPGARVVSTVPGGYATYSGTSMAAPHVSAEAALLYQVPGATKQQVMQWIKSTCDGRDLDVQCGGQINVYRAVHLAMKGWDPATQTPPSPTAPTPPAPMP